MVGRESQARTLLRPLRNYSDYLKSTAQTPIHAPPVAAAALIIKRHGLDLLIRLKENRVILATGNKVIYPSQGPCLIGPVIKIMVDGKPIRFYQLALLDDSGGELFVP